MLHRSQEPGSTVPPSSCGADRAGVKHGGVWRRDVALKFLGVLRVTANVTMFD
jgi:hypothetical protein